MSKERYPDLNENEDIIMDDTREEHWRDVAKDSKDKSNILYLRLDLYSREME